MIDGVQEFNSVEAIKGAVQYGLGAAFVSSAAIAKELDLGLFKRIDISGVRLSRTLSLASTPALPASLSANVCLLAAIIALPPAQHDNEGAHTIGGRREKPHLRSSHGLISRSAVGPLNCYEKRDVVSASQSKRNQA